MIRQKRNHQGCHRLRQASPVSTSTISPSPVHLHHLPPSIPPLFNLSLSFSRSLERGGEREPALPGPREDPRPRDVYPWGLARWFLRFYYIALYARVAGAIFTLLLDGHFCTDTIDIHHEYFGSTSVQENQMVETKIEDCNS